MVKERNVIGEGAYGCVHKPSLHCLNTNKNTNTKPKINYKNVVSKIMKTEDAEKELKEFIVIGSYDNTNEYHLGMPILCPPELNDKIINNEISKCKHIDFKEVKKDPNDYKILLLKFGGPDLKNLCNSQLKTYLKKNTKLKTDKFWLEVHHLLKGIKFFKDNGIVHNDIKPQNILFDMKTNKLVFIDFGLMRSKEEIVSSSKKSDNFLGIYHWSFPFDCGLMNRNKWTAYKKLTKAKKTTYKNQLYKMIVNDSKKNTFNISIKNPSSFNLLFSYINPNEDTLTDSVKYGYIEQFFDGYNNLVSESSYETMLDETIDSIDVYGLGFTLQYILNCFYRQNVLDQFFFKRLSTFFHKMYDFNPETREINIDNLIDEYENILLDTGILTRLKKSFENHTIVNNNQNKFGKTCKPKFKRVSKKTRKQK
jgi:serine/threonine protein kinase